MTRLAVTRLAVTSFGLLIAAMPSLALAANPSTPTAAPPAPPSATGPSVGTSLDVAVDSTADRRAAFEAGSQAIAEKRWGDAHRIFANLWKGQKSYDVALHLGQVEFHLKQYREAAGHLAYGMMLLPPREKPEIAERGRAILALCQREIGTLELRVRNKGAAVLVDGEPVAEAPLVTDIYVDPGKHRFVVQLEGHESETWESEFAVGTTQKRVVELKAKSAGSSDKNWVLSGATTSSDLPDSRHHSSWVPVLVGGGLTLLGVGTGIGLAVYRGGLTEDANDIRSDLGNSSACRGSSPDPQCDTLKQKNRDYDSYGTVEAVSFGVAGAALIATASYFFLARPDQNRAVSTSQSSNIRFYGSFGKSSAGVSVVANF